MKWIGGVILLIITIILLILAMFMFPWFTTKTTYERDTINDPEKGRPIYWEESVGGVERDWDESVYYLQDYELKTSRDRVWGNNSPLNSTSSGKMRYNSDPSSGGWDGSYGNIVEAGYPVPGYLAGGDEQLNVFNYTYYMAIFAIILAIVGIIMVLLAGLGKIGHKIPKVVVGAAIVLVVLSPLYFALVLPSAIETDNKELFRVKDPLNNDSTFSRPAEASGIWGDTNEFDQQTKQIFSSKEFRPGLGWWLAIGAIFTTILALAFTSGPAPAAPKGDERWRRKYQEFDRPNDRDHDNDYGPPSQQRPGDNRHYDDHYRDGNGYDNRSDYYDDYDRRPPRQPAQPPGYDYGRPTPRPPMRRDGNGHQPPGRRGRRRPPARY